MTRDWAYAWVSFRPYGAGESAWNAFPGLRYAPSGAILGPSLREETQRFAGKRRERNQSRQQRTFMRFPRCPARDISTDGGWETANLNRRYASSTSTPFRRSNSTNPG